MPEEMCAALNRFFRLRHYKKRGEAFGKNFGIFRKKLIPYYFSVLTIADPLTRGPDEISTMSSFLIRPCWDPQVNF